MPYHVVEGGAGCPTERPWAVVKDATGELVECHVTESDANDHVKALYVAETETLPDAEDYAAAGVPDEAPLWGVLAPEGVVSGDGRQFANGVLTWDVPPLPLRWNKEDSHGRDSRTVAVNVGRIDRIARHGEELVFSGTLNLAEPDGARVRDLIERGNLRGISIDTDSIADADVEFVWPEDALGDGDPADMLLGQPEKMIFHAGRIRAATLTDIPAFTEARVQLGLPPEGLFATGVVAAGTVAFSAVAVHHTDTSDGPWDAAANEARLESPLSESAARDAYAWIDDSQVEDGQLPKSAARFIHHEVDASGNPGAANLAACSASIAVLHGGRGGTTIPEADYAGVYDHVAAHLKDAGREPAAFSTRTSLSAAGESADTWTPPAAWFSDPKLSVPTPITVDASGRVYGHAAQWGTCHMGYTDQCVTPPREATHDYFLTGTRVADGGEHVPVGQITLATGHAPLHASARSATEHYDNTGAAVADVSVGNDVHGIWVAGAVRPSADANRVHELRASGSVSGDWRRIGGKLRLVGLLAVNVPGYPVPRMRARVASGQLHALVAAGAPTVARPRTLEMTQAEALRVVMSMVREQISGGE